MRWAQNQISWAKECFLALWQHLLLCIKCHYYVHNTTCSFIKCLYYIRNTTCSFVLNAIIVCPWECNTYFLKSIFNWLLQIMQHTSSMLWSFTAQQAKLVPLHVEMHNTKPTPYKEHTHNFSIKNLNSKFQDLLKLLFNLLHIFMISTTR